MELSDRGRSGQHQGLASLDGGDTTGKLNTVPVGGMPVGKLADLIDTPIIAVALDAPKAIGGRAVAGSTISRDTCRGMCYRRLRRRRHRPAPIARTKNVLGSGTGP